MGISLSTIQEELDTVSSPIPTPAVMNIILRYLLQETRLKDFSMLSDQQICKKYITFMANDFYKYFYELQIYPEEKEGRLLFRKGSELEYDIKDEDRQKACFTLAYFYIRIFQIYGAIALTVVENVSQVASAMTRRVDSKEQIVGATGPGSVPFQVGGAFSYGHYRFLETYSNPYSDNIIVLNFTVAPYYPKYIIYFKFDDSEERRGIFIIENSTKKRYYHLLTNIDEGDNLFYINLTNITTRKRHRNSLMEGPVTIKYDQTTRQYTLKNRSVSLYFNDFFAKLIDYIENEEGIQHPNATAINPNTTPPPSDERLAISRLKDALSKTTHRPVCIARALQLLRKLDDGKSVSQICKTSFSDASGQSSRSGVPIKGESLSKSIGLDSLSTLFYTISRATPELSLGDHNQYARFILLMAQRFGDHTITDATNTELFTKQLSDIRDRRDKVECKDVPEEIPLDPDTVKDVEKVVGDLYTKQKAHSAKCMSIINQLFKITYNGPVIVSIQVHPNVLSKGIPELERINRDTRELLIKYYEECESTYIDGMEIVLDNHSAVAAAAAAPARNYGAAPPGPPHDPVPRANPARNYGDAPKFNPTAPP